MRHAVRTTRFSRFFLNSFLRFEVFAGACVVASCCLRFFCQVSTLASISIRSDDSGTFQRPRGPTSGPRLSSSPRRRPSADPCASAHWCACAGHAPQVRRWRIPRSIESISRRMFIWTSFAGDPLDAALGFDRLAKTVDLFLGQIFHPSWCDPRSAFAQSDFARGCPMP